MVVRFAVAGAALIALFVMPPAELREPPRAPAPHPIPAVDTSRVAVLKRAIQFHTDQKYADAIARYDSARIALPEIADWISVFAASSASYLGDTAQVARRLADAGDDLTAWAWRVPIRAYRKAEAPERALTLARAATGSSSVWTRAAAWQLVEELAGTLTAAEKLKAGRAFLQTGDVTNGVRELEAVLKSGTVDSETRADLHWEMGRALFNGGRYKAALENLEAVPRSHARRADARFMMGRANYRLDKTSDGKRIFREVAEVYPKSHAATSSRFFLADLAHDDGDADRAFDLFEKAAASSAKGDLTSLAMMRAGGIAFTQKEYDTAASIFERYRTTHPRGAYLDQATYWAAQSALRQGEESRGKALLRLLTDSSRFSYYGLRAGRQLGKTPPLIMPQDTGPATSEKTRNEVQAGLVRWKLLHEVGWDDAASMELTRLRRHFGSDTSALYEIAEELAADGEPHLSIAIGRDLQDSGRRLDLRLLRILYPMPYEDVIVREAGARGLDPYFVAALIRQESRFNKDAASGAGAIGLMQVLPSTGRQLGRKVGVSNVTAATLKQPEVNIKLGTSFLADLMQMYGGRTDAVLAAYNAGPSRADRWRNFPEFASEDLFIERIPYDETRGYVKVVELNAAVYRALYGGPPTGD